MSGNFNGGKHEMFSVFRRILLLAGNKGCTNVGTLHKTIVYYRPIHIANYFQASELPSNGYFQFSGPVPQDRLTIKFARSSGPGGQNVNKVNTKVEVRFHVGTADWIPEEVRAKLLQRERNRVNKSGELVVTSTKFRSQQRNVEDAISKVQDMIKEASYVPGTPSQEQQQHVRKLAKRFNERRLQEKKYASLKKRGRRSDD